MIAGIENIKGLLNLANDFTNESSWGWTFNARKALNTFLTYIENQDTDVIYLEKEGVPAGWAMVCIDDDFHDEKIGYVVKFYVAKDSRGTGVGRDLSKECTKWFKKMGCKDSFVTATGNIDGEEKLFQNLMKKEGYRECGEAMVKHYE